MQPAWSRNGRVRIKLFEIKACYSEMKGREMKVNQLDGYVKSLLSDKTEVFKNWVTLDEKAVRVFRSSQPYYQGKDELQKFDTPALKLLDIYNIKCIVSLNENGLQPGADVTLKNKGISYKSLPVKDFSVPTLDQLLTGCDAITTALDKGGNALVYCGYGQGRTGVMMTAYQLYSLKKPSKEKFEELMLVSTYETGQRPVLESFHKKLCPELYK